MQTLTPKELLVHPTTPAVREQLARIYEDTDYIIAGTLGRTAIMGGQPDYWYRSHGELRDIDVHDPHDKTDVSKSHAIDNAPLPIDIVSSRWLHPDGEDAVLSLPRDPRVNVRIPGSSLETVENSLLGIPVRTFKPEVMLGLNIAVPYDRLRQRKGVKQFHDWVVRQPDFDPSVLEPFQDMATQIKQTHPEYVRSLRAKDLVSQLPTPVYNAARGAYRRFHR